jgi:hypothetical protein
MKSSPCVNAVLAPSSGASSSTFAFSHLQQYSFHNSTVVHRLGHLPHGVDSAGTATILRRRKQCGMLALF